MILETISIDLPRRPSYPFQRKIQGLRIELVYCMKISPNCSGIRSFSAGFQRVAVVALLAVASLSPVACKKGSAKADPPDVPRTAGNSPRPEESEDERHRQGGSRNPTTPNAAAGVTEADIELLMKSTDMDLVRSELARIFRSDSIGSIRILAEVIARSKTDSRDFSEMAASVIADLYIKGEIHDMSEVMESIAQTKGKQARSRLASDLFLALVRTPDGKDAVVRAFTEICERPSPQTPTIGELAAAAAVQMGFEKTLLMIPSKEVFGANAFKQTYLSIIQTWMSQDSIACSSYIRDCPVGEHRNDCVGAMVQNLARTGFIEDAEIWYALLPEGSIQAVLAKEQLDEMRRRHAAEPR